METVIYALLVLTPFIYFPLYVFEEFETPRTFLLVTFACFSMFKVNWRFVLKDPVAMCLASFVAAMGVSAYFSIDWYMSVFGSPRTPNGLLVWASYLVFYLAAKEELSPRIVSRILMTTSLFVSIYSIVQWFGVDFKQWEGGLYEHGLLRPPGTFGQPNLTSAYLACVFPFIMWRMTIGPKIEKIVAVLAAMSSFTAIVLSQSRGMWWALLVGVLVYFLKRGVSWKRIVMHSTWVFAIVIGVVIGLKTPVQGFKDRLRLSFSLENARVEYLRGAFRIALDNPWLGSGPDTFEIAYDNQRSPYYWSIEGGGSPHRAHNEFLNVLATQGAVGSILFLTLCLMALGLILSKDCLLSAAAGSIAAFYVQELSLFHTSATMLVFLVSLVLIAPEREK